MRQVPIGNSPGGSTEVRILEHQIATVAMWCCEHRSSVNLADNSAINTHVRSCMACLQIVAEYLFMEVVKREAKIRPGPTDQFVIPEISLEDSLEVLAIHMYQATYAPYLVTEQCPECDEMLEALRNA